MSIEDEVWTESIYWFLLVITLVSVGLLFGRYPDDASWLLGHSSIAHEIPAAATTDRANASGKSQTDQRLPDVQTPTAGITSTPIVGLSSRGRLSSATVHAISLIVVVPLSSALLLVWSHKLGDTSQFFSFRTFHPEEIALAVAIVSMSAWSAYFASSYHFGILLLAAAAWVFGFHHSNEILATAKKVGEAQEVLNGTASLLHRTNMILIEANRVLVKINELAKETNSRLDRFHRDEFRHFMRNEFAPAAKDAHSVLSVERYWNVDADLWQGVTKRGTSHEVLFRSVIDGLRDGAKSDFYSVIERAKGDVLFVGAPLHRLDTIIQSSQSTQQAAMAIDAEVPGVPLFDKESFWPFVGLIHTACVFELARKTLAHQSRRIRCTVADVPLWGKLVGDEMWTFSGVPPTNFYYDKSPHDNPASTRIHFANVAAFDRLFREIEHTASSATTYVFSLILESASLCEISYDMPVSEHIEGKLFATLFGAELDNLVATPNYRSHIVPSGRGEYGQMSEDMIKTMVETLVALTMCTNADDIGQITRAYYETSLQKMWQAIA